MRSKRGSRGSKPLAAAAAASRGRQAADGAFRVALSPRRAGMRPIARRASLRAPLSWLALGLALCVGPAGAATPSPSPDAAVSGQPGTASLPPALVDTLFSAGLIGRGEPVAAFDWILETKRPTRPPRRFRERFDGGRPGLPVGLSPVVHETLSPKPRGPRRGISVRGLTVVHPGDTVLDVQVQGLQLPLSPGARFRLDYDEDGSSLTQHCVVGATLAASTVHPAMPGSARSIECDGRGRYHGIPVRAGATVLYFEALGVFLQVEQHIDTPLGRLRGSTRVIDFEMATR